MCRSDGKPGPAAVKSQATKSAPRACGAGPSQTLECAPNFGCSPRVRGWSPRAALAALPRVVLPARAGLVPASAPGRRATARAPRACGVGPDPYEDVWALRTCSPRVRGWSRRELRLDGRAQALPARAGLVPTSWCPLSIWSRAPRACGDGPGSRRTTTSGVVCSPRVRGWARRHEQGLHLRHVLPARAGLFRVPRSGRTRRSGDPRVCRAGPACRCGLRDCRIQRYVREFGAWRRVGAPPGWRTC